MDVLVFCLYGFKYGYYSFIYIFFKWVVYFNVCVLSFDFGEGFICCGRIEFY